MTTDKTKLIASQNDQFRQNFGLPIRIHIPSIPNGKYGATIGILNLGDYSMNIIKSKIRAYDEFNEDNDPHGEHDFGQFSVNGNDIFWKIDYYDNNYENGSEDPSDLSKTRRVLTVMLASEY